MEKRNCKRCDRSFTPYRDWQKYCSKACKSAEDAELLQLARDAGRKAKAKKVKRKRSAKRAPRCQINAEATRLARAAMELHGYSSPSEAVVAALRGEMPTSADVSRFTAVSGGSDG